MYFDHNLQNFLYKLAHLPFLGTVYYQCWGYQDETLKLLSQQYRA
jgi:hypothetical protein